MTEAVTEAVTNAVRHAAVAPFGTTASDRAIGAFAHHLISELGTDLALRLFAAIGQREGIEGVQAAAERYAHGMLYLDVELWAPCKGAPVEGLTAGVGLIYGPQESRIMDFHIVRSAAPTAPRVPRPMLMRILTNVGVFCDRNRIWCYGASRWGVFAYIAARHPDMGFTKMETTYAHADGATYAFFLRPPC